jgi:hypothetical protein
MQETQDLLSQICSVTNEEVVCFNPISRTGNIKYEAALLDMQN